MSLTIVVIIYLFASFSVYLFNIWMNVLVFPLYIVEQNHKVKSSSKRLYKKSYSVTELKCAYIPGKL